MPVNVPVKRCRLPQDSATHRILIQRNGAHGDILMATPVLDALRAAYPDAHLTWIVESKERGAIDAHPKIDELLLWDSQFWHRLRKKSRRYFSWCYQQLRLRTLLRSKNYDTFISFQPEEWSDVARFCGARTRIGIFDTFRQFNNNAPTSRNTRFYTHSFTFDDLPAHRTEQYLLSLKPLGVPVTTSRMSMGFTAQDALAAQALMPNGKQLVILAPFTTWKSRCWPADNYRRLGDLLQQKGYQVILIGSAKEAEAAQAIATRMVQPPLVVAGTLTFREMAALTRKAALVVSGDTGPMHVAAAVGTPFLSLFGPTPVAGRRPLSGDGVTLMEPVPCGPCDQEFCPNNSRDFMRCMRLLTVRTVSDEALWQLAHHISKAGVRGYDTSAVR